MAPDVMILWVAIMLRTWKSWFQVQAQGVAIFCSDPPHKFQINTEK
jgi:hypothetical protein